jgi:hypothetical protein
MDSAHKEWIRHNTYTDPRVKAKHHATTAVTNATTMIIASKHTDTTRSIDRCPQSKAPHDKSAEALALTCASPTIGVL